LTLKTGMYAASAEEATTQKTVTRVLASNSHGFNNNNRELKRSINETSAHKYARKARADKEPPDGSKDVWRTAMLSENLHGRGGRTGSRGRFCGVGACYRLGQHLDGGNALFKAGCRRNIFRWKFPHGRCARPAKVENKTRCRSGIRVSIGTKFYEICSSTNYIPSMLFKQHAV
jgi:hypothetical protein